MNIPINAETFDMTVVYGKDRPELGDQHPQSIKIGYVIGQGLDEERPDYLFIDGFGDNKICTLDTLPDGWSVVTGEELPTPHPLSESMIFPRLISATDDEERTEGGEILRGGYIGSLIYLDREKKKLVVPSPEVLATKILSGRSLSTSLNKEVSLVDRAHYMQYLVARTIIWCILQAHTLEKYSDYTQELVSVGQQAQDMQKENLERIERIMQLLLSNGPDQTKQIQQLITTKGLTNILENVVIA